MKYLPLIALTVALSACAGQPPAGVQSVGQSQQPPRAVGTCIAHKWADASQQQVVSQTMLANDQAMDVYVPGQQPPNGAAAVVRPNGQGSWVGFRSAGAGGSQATSAISGCL
ncbi:hypothetical protein [Paraburkholderia sp. ZP32-5]|uniref:hypothetical protein n=1 Tax=Paraburkholderia sp. ZP32-5 TaxID=2883245 RepID=UPI001F202331|nr:hypothetical protein [Paraburkholderia sp. ZP32-5]